jgi:hypothetical protein
MAHNNLKKSLKQILILSLLVAFLINLFTGLIKFPELQHFFLFVYNYVSPGVLSRWHDYSGLALVALIIIHLIVIRKRLFIWFPDFFKKVRNSNMGKAKLFIILISLTLFVAAAVISFLVYRQSPVSLSAVEIKDYQGEKLGSINDFRENSIKGPQHVDIGTYRLEITGLVSTSTSYSYDEILKLPAYKKVVTLNCVEDWSVKALWEGVLVKDLLKDVTIKPEAKTIIFYAVDGYSTSFPLEYVINNNIMMADKLNGVVLPPERGFPFQLVAEQKWGYKWIKWINKIELSSDTNYKGFWESYGYNNDGSLNGSKYAK